MAATLGVTLTGSQDGPLRDTAITAAGRGHFIWSQEFIVSAQDEELLGLVVRSWSSHYANGTRHNTKAIRHKEGGN